MKSTLTIIILTVLTASTGMADGQVQCPAGAHHTQEGKAPRLDSEALDNIPASEDQWFETMLAPRHPAPYPRPDLRPASPAGDWGPMIDAAWGPGFGGAEQYILFWNWITLLENQYPSFNNYDVDLYGLYSPLIPEVQAGISKGRFYAIMNGLGGVLHNAHVNYRDYDIYGSQPAPGVPLLVGHQYSVSNPFHSGVCLTTDENGEIFVYDLVVDHPWGLEVGDVILGFDGVPWDDLYPQLLAAELPMTGTTLTADAAYEYGWRVAAADNWHLFDTLDVRKYGTGEVQHLATSLMVDAGVDMSLYCDDVLNDDLPRPTSPDYVTYDVMDVGMDWAWSYDLNPDTLQIAFLRCDSWSVNTNAEQAWHDACLAAVNDTSVDGLIVDFRNNTGGNVDQADAGFEHLFDETILTVNYGYRASTTDHMAMVEGSYEPGFAIPGDPADVFDKPIAMLLGPKTLSSGDTNALRLAYHPMVRSFGRATSGTFDSPVSYTVAGHPEFWFRYGFWNCFQVAEPGVWLSHWGFPVDEEIWFTPEASRQRIDPVIERAKDWIYRLVSPVADLPAMAGSRILAASPNPFNPRTVIRFQVDRAGPCQVEIYDLAGRALRSRRWDRLEVGPHEFTWDGVQDSGRSAPSGAYLVRLTAQDGSDVTRVSLVK